MTSGRARRHAEEIHRRFSALPGAERIATRTAVEGLIVWLQRERPTRVLELGAGIGTLTAAIASTLQRLHGDGGFRFVSVERDSFCLSQLDRNLGELRSAVEIVPSPPEGDAARKAETSWRPEFLVADGGDPSDRSPFQRLAQGATVFIEGDREPQARGLEASLSGRSWAAAEVRGLRRRRAHGRWWWDGGYRIYRLEPDAATRLLLLGLRLRTSLVYRLRPVLGLRGS